MAESLTAGANHNHQTQIDRGTNSVFDGPTAGSSTFLRHGLPLLCFSFSFFWRKSSSSYSRLPIDFVGLVGDGNNVDSNCEATMANSKSVGALCYFFAQQLMLMFCKI
jgi:hypothetical protein